MAFVQQLDPAVLKQLTSGQFPNGWTIDGQLLQQALGSGYGESGTPGIGMSGINPDVYYDIGTNKDRYGVYDSTGKFLGDESKESSSAQLGRFVAGAAAMYGLGSALGGGFPGLGGGVTPMGDLGTMDAMGVFTGADPATSAAWSAGAGLGKDTLSALGANSAAPAAAAPGALSGLAKALSGAGSLGNVIGAALGAASARDQEQSANQTSTSKTTKDPYAPAKPFLDQMIGQGQQLATQYQQQPFSAAQQTGFNNLGGLLNAINGGAGALLQGMGAASSGANNFDRGNPRKALQGGGINLGGWSPGLLQFFKG